MMNDTLQKKLDELIGHEGYLTDILKKFSLDGISPQSIAVPRSVQEVSAVMKFAHSEKLSVIPWGGGTSITMGMPLQRYDIVLHLQKLNSILEFEPADLTCSVQAGITLQSLNHTLEQNNSFIPIDPPLPQYATIGGITAANMYGPLRYHYGMIKDQVVGMEMALSDGTIVKGGGKVVKNVAGYDVHKIFIGSLGTLGVITQVNLKLHPLPQVKKTMLLCFDSIPAAIDAAKEFVDSFLLPEFMVICCRGAFGVVADKGSLSIPEGTVGLFIGTDNHPENSQWQIEEITRRMEKRRGSSLLLIDDDMQDQVRRLIRNYPETFAPDLIVKNTFLLSQFDNLYLKQKKLQEMLHHTAYLIINPGCGYMHLLYSNIDSLCDSEKEKYIHFLKEESKIISECSGTMSLEKAPAWIKKNVPVWNSDGTDIALMRTIKKSFDPFDIMSPGRLSNGC